MSLAALLSACGGRDHEEVTDPAVAATCTAEGLTEGKHCSKCGEVFTAQAILAAFAQK